MVTINSSDVAVGRKRPLFIYITGCDGTGKSTQAQLLLQQLKTVGLTTCHLWLRFPFFFSLPLLIYARWRGMSWYEMTDNVRHGYWDFRNSRLMRRLFPWTLLVDATWAALWKVYLPLWQGKSIVCERFVLDMLVDMALAFDQEMHQTVVGQLFLRLLPDQTQIFILDLDAFTVCERRTDLRLDKRLPDRLAAFKRLTRDLNLTVLSSQQPIHELNESILNFVEVKYDR